MSVQCSKCGFVYNISWIAMHEPTCTGPSHNPHLPFNASNYRDYYGYVMAELEDACCFWFNHPPTGKQILDSIRNELQYAPT